MKIQNANNIYNIFSNRVSNKQSNPINFGMPKLNLLQNDVVSFKAKSYDADSVAISTNHCAYCGCKVYTEVQMKAIASSMLANHSDRLQGEIKSVLEKLSAAKRSDELTVAKQNENKEEIEFFEKLFEQSKDKDKGYLSGEEIFEQVYGLNSQEAMAILMKNMRPLTRTVDHVSPQNLDEESKNADINLVEACYCCNHDIKKGMPFASFYSMYPSIKNNMPTAIFDYAYSHITEGESSSLSNRISASDLMRCISGLFSQRTDTLNRLKNIDFRLAEVKSSIFENISVCEADIKDKQVEIEKYKSALASIESDEEYKAMCTRMDLLHNKELNENFLSYLKNARTANSNSMNELTNPSKKGKKSKPTMTEEETEHMIREYKETIMQLNGQIEKAEDEEIEISLQIQELDEKFPTIEILTSQKHTYEGLLASHRDLAEEILHQQQLSSSLSEKQELLKSLTQELQLYSKDDFDLGIFSQEEQAQYEEYSSLLSALEYVEQHNNGNGVKVLINDFARAPILGKIEVLKQLPVVKASLDYKRRKEIETTITKTNKEISVLQSQLYTSTKRIEQLNNHVSTTQVDEVQSKLDSVVKDIKRLQDKQAYLKYPQIISKLQSEILLAQNTISELKAKLQEIDSTIGANT